MHQIIDAKQNFIIDVCVTPGNVLNSIIYLDHILNRFGGHGLDTDHHDFCQYQRNLTIYQNYPFLKRGTFSRSPHRRGINRHTDESYHEAVSENRLSALESAFTVSGHRLYPVDHANLLPENDCLNCIFSILCLAERLELVEHKKDESICFL